VSEFHLTVSIVAQPEGRAIETRLDALPTLHISIFLELICVQSDKHRDGSRCGSLKAAPQPELSIISTHARPSLQLSYQPTSKLPSFSNFSSCLQIGLGQIDSGLATYNKS
jgi:hypothetical protein